MASGIWPSGVACDQAGAASPPLNNPPLQTYLFDSYTLSLFTVQTSIVTAGPPCPPIMHMTEAQFQSSLIKWAKTFGWRVHAERPAQYRDGRWATHIQGDPGFLDLTLVRPPRLIFAELKVGRNKAGDYQLHWLADLGMSGAEVYIWRPEDWPQILVVLSK